MNKTLAFALAMAPAATYAAVQYEEVPVVDVEPVMATVEVVEPERRCWFEDTRERGWNRTGESSPTTPLIGALIGGAIGNAVGHNKRNKQVGAVVGAVLGGSIAHDMRRRDADVGNGRIRTTRQEVCEVVDRTTTEQRVTGYLVTYRYAGKTHRARMDQRPGETIRVRVHVTPA